MTRPAARKPLEAMLDHCCAVWSARGEAAIHRGGLAAHVAGRDDRGRLIVRASPSRVDYVGLLRGGRAVVFEAKETGADFLDIGNRTHVPGHQLADLAAVAQLGGLAFLVVSLAGRVGIVAHDHAPRRVRLADLAWTAPPGRLPLGLLDAAREAFGVVHEAASTNCSSATAGSVNPGFSARATAGGACRSPLDQQLPGAAALLRSAGYSLAAEVLER